MTAKHRTTLVAALSGAPETGVVLRTALGVAQLMGMGVEAIHVTEDAQTEHAAVVAAHANGVRVHHRQGDVVPQLLEAFAPPRVFGAVMGTRALIAGPRPAGSVALEVLRATSKPVVFTPPDVEPHRGFVPRRLLVPVDGSEEVSRAVLEMERNVRPDANLEITVLYTLDGFTPPMVDRPEYDFPAWGKEFVLRHLPGEHRLFEWRTGDPGNAVIEVAEQAQSDVIVLYFGGNIDVGHGAVVWEVLARSPIPVLVLPTSWGAPRDDRRKQETSLSAR